MRCDCQRDCGCGQKVSFNVPLVVRLEGTNVELGKQILKESGLNIVAAESMADGAEKIVAVGANKLERWENGMSILVNKDTKVICQGITGSTGLFHTKAAVEYGTKW